MKALITGINGFVGQYLKKELLMNGYQVTGIDLTVKCDDDLNVDILNYGMVLKVITEQKPDVIFHLAGQASVAKSWDIPQLTMELNVIGALNILEAVRKSNMKTKIVLVGSSDQYGKISEEKYPINETTEQLPNTPYAVSKRAQEDIGKIYANAYHMNIYMTRSFNHVGVGQAMGFVVPDLAYGIAEIEKGIKEKLIVGNLESYRDFADVRDIVRAYRLISERGINGSVYNIGSGKCSQIKELLNILISYANKPIKIETNQSRMRVMDTPVLQCDYGLLQRDTGWKPEIPIENTLQQMLDYYRCELEGK